MKFNIEYPTIQPCVEPKFNKSFFLLAFTTDYDQSIAQKEEIWNTRHLSVTVGYNSKEDRFILSCFDRKKEISKYFNKDVIKFLKGDFTKMSNFAKDTLSEFCNKTYNPEEDEPYDLWIENNYYKSEWYHNIQPALYSGKLHTITQARLYDLEDCEEFPANNELWSKPDLEKEDYYYWVVQVPNMTNSFIELKTVLYAQP